jgi:hypothetical protein
LPSTLVLSRRRMCWKSSPAISDCKASNANRASDQSPTRDGSVGPQKKIGRSSYHGGSGWWSSGARRSRRLRLRGVGFLLSLAAAASRGELYSWECDGVEATLVAADRRLGWMRRCVVRLRGVGLTDCFDLVWACMGRNIRFMS